MNSDIRLAVGILQAPANIVSAPGSAADAEDHIENIRELHARILGKLAQFQLTPEERQIIESLYELIYRRCYHTSPMTNGQRYLEGLASAIKTHLEHAEYTFGDLKKAVNGRRTQNLFLLLWDISKSVEPKDAEDTRFYTPRDTVDAYLKKYQRAIEAYQQSIQGLADDRASMRGLQISLQWVRIAEHNVSDPAVYEALKVLQEKLATPQAVRDVMITTQDRSELILEGLDPALVYLITHTSIPESSALTLNGMAMPQDDEVISKFAGLLYILFTDPNLRVSTSPADQAREGEVIPEKNVGYYEEAILWSVRSATNGTDPVRTTIAHRIREILRKLEIW